MAEGHSRFLTSGGEAVTQMRVPFKEMFMLPDRQIANAPQMIDEPPDTITPAFASVVGAVWMHHNRPTSTTPALGNQFLLVLVSDRHVTQTLSSYCAVAVFSGSVFLP